MALVVKNPPVISLVTQLVKNPPENKKKTNLPAMRETLFNSWVWKLPLEKG